MQSLLRYMGIVMMSFLAGCAGRSITTTIEADGEMALVLRIPDAERVEFICSCDDFSSRPAKRIDGRTWSVPIPALQSFTYFFRIDGRVYLPDCDFRQRDDFGSEICIHQNIP